MLISQIDKIDKVEWGRLVEMSPSASFFQTENCYRFYESLSFMEPFVFALAKEKNIKGIIVGYIQQERNPVKQFLTRRAIIPGGAMLDEDITENELTELLTGCRKQLSSKAIYIEFRNFQDYTSYKKTFCQCGFAYNEHYNFHIDTSSEDVMMGNLGKSRKRDIRTSLRDGAVIAEEPTLNDVKAYYEILHDLYRTKVKTPLFPYEFFEKLYLSGYGIYRLIRLGCEIIGGTLCVPLQDKALYEWFACGKDGAYKNIYPSTMATFAGMTYGMEHGYPLFDMMGAGSPGDGGYGVRDFKAKFGGKLVEHGRFLCINNSLLYNIGALGVKIIKRH